ncbi:hypothetical protein B0H17DRAFT_1141723 [Mycena rosella]|uniref:Uncharacterized protein n=1 Tax=Mycena rosella TaxID=1033263 RepID=A0AAD7G8R0_MYCRO|nr:hypothetical protein B0H17DRAFT_1141723 [Mycena rosella]
MAAARPGKLALMYFFFYFLLLGSSFWRLFIFLEDKIVESGSVTIQFWMAQNPRNEPIFAEVAELAANELKNERPALGVELFKDMAKNSFRSLKRQWLRANNVEGGGAYSLLKLIARVKGISTSEKILDAYADKYHLDPVVLKGLVHQEYLSDEVSGPEDETRETKEAWKVRMAALTDMSLARAALEKVEFLEVLLPAWHTTIKQTENTVYYRVYTDQVSHRIPLFAPYNFDFITEWLECTAPTARSGTY